MAETAKARAARKAFEEPRAGEVLVPLTAAETAKKSRQLAAEVNERERLLDEKKALAQAIGEKVRSLTESIDVLAEQVEYGKQWVPAQAQFDDLFSRD